MQGNGRGQCSILVVDDMPENTRVLEAFLGSRGYRIQAVHNGRDALAHVAETPPDIILLDLVMPGLSGYDVCQRLKSDPQTRHIPVIIVTGVAAKEANVKALEAGADDFLVKPFDAVLLEARLQASLERKRLQDELLASRRQLVEQNSSLEQRVRERTGQVERIQHVTAFSLAKLAESRDVETGAHLERIRAYTREVACEMRARNGHGQVIDDAFIDQLYHATPLHDIGKVGIPDRLLLKPGKLSRDEFDVMKEHARIGGDCLRAADHEAGGDSFLSMGRDIAYCHHEKWDGTGYPAGMAGEEIPLPARIVAVVDVYDALSSRRPYKEPFPHDKCMSIIDAGRGTHFDPEVHDAFTAALPRILAIHDRYKEGDGLSPIQAIVERLEAPPRAPREQD